jgi:hypothetical protein
MLANKIDFPALNRLALQNLPAVFGRFLPGGITRGHEYIARNPTRTDRALGSFKVNLHSGRWADFATGDGGGDIISLVAYVKNTGQLEAAIYLTEQLGMSGRVES